jgi:Flp pilus assembly pilin Flp
MKPFLAQERGQSTIEYGLIGVLVSIVAIITIGDLGNLVSTLLSGVLAAFH